VRYLQRAGLPVAGRNRSRGG